MSELGKVCKHGSLTRSCEVCDLESQLRAAQEKLALAEKALKEISQGCPADRPGHCKNTVTEFVLIAKSVLESYRQHGKQSKEGI